MNYVTIAENIYRGRKTEIKISDTDRLRHLYMIGKTGVGKSTLFQNLALQDIRNGRGVCYIDPHGESVNWLLERIPEERFEDCILLDPADEAFPFGLNLLDSNDEREKDFLVSETINIFYKLFDPTRSGVIGPQFEHWLRNAALTIMGGPGGGSLIEIPKLFIDPNFEKYKRSFIKDPLVLEFWTKQMARTSDYHRSEMLNYFTSKFGHFLNNKLMRNVIGQQASTFTFDEILANQKIVLVDLSKGKLGETNAQFLGLILLAKLQSAILRRTKLPEYLRYPFFLFVDEFQSMVTDTFASMLSESRKYGLGVHLTNQYFAQLPKQIQDAILGNCGTLLTFTLGSDDAEIFAHEFPPFTTDDFINQEKQHMYMKLMINGKTSHAFSARSLAPIETGKINLSIHLKTLSRLAYCFPKDLVEEQIRYQLS